MTTNNPFADQPHANPYQAPLQSGYAAADPNLVKEISRQATASLVVGIISFFCFGIILGPFAIYRGNKALRLIRQHNIGQEHKTTATVGMVLGWVVLGLNILVLGLYAVMIIGITRINGSKLMPRQPQ